MINYADMILKQETLLELLNYKGYTDTEVALRIALEKIAYRIYKTNGDWTKKRLDDVRKLIEEEVTKSYGGLFESIQQETKEILAVTATSLGSSIAKDTIDSLVTRDKEILGYKFKDIFKLQEDNHVRQLKVLLGSEVALGSSLPKIVKALDKKNNNLTKGNLKTAIRTVTKQAREDAKAAVFERLDINSWTYLATLDSRTSETCANLDGRVFNMPFKDIPLNARPPLHWNCRSSLIPKSQEKGTRASQFGQVEDMSYGQWFKTQDEKFQKKVLGARKYKLFKEGKYTVGNTNDFGKVNVTLEDFKALIA